jgi:NAD(P)-dependent dehydrogenase (short-subunit alcohol dehydrogenase family)
VPGYLVMKTRNAVVVITGASSGIGRATALELAERGASVVLVARREEALQELAEECERLGGKALAIPTDVSIEEHVHGVARKAAEHFGKIDVWINNAAITVAGHFEEIPMDDFRRVLEVNLFGYIYGSRAAVNHFKGQGKGIIINVSSMVGLTGEPYFAPYVISKFAIRGLGISLNQELINENIQVCTVLPAVIDTPLYNQSANYMGKAIKVPGEPIPAEEVAQSIVGLIKKPKSEIFVGAKGKLAAVMRFIAPRFFDEKSHEMILEEHFEQEKEVVNSQGNLYNPMKEYASVSGGWIPEGEPTFLKYVIPVTSLITGLAVGFAFMQKNKKRKLDPVREPEFVESY